MIECQRLGVVDYRQAMELQKKLVVRRITGEIGDHLLLLEHPPVITQGKRECAEDFISSPDTMMAQGIDFVRVDRGGRLTYHGPGQLIGYFICDVNAVGGVKAFVGSIEEMLIAVCRDFGIDAVRDAECPGVWVGRDKIAAVGLHVMKNISSHGFALNVKCDLKPYRHIVACGLNDRGITTMQMNFDGIIDMNDVINSVEAHSESKLYGEG